MSEKVKKMDSPRSKAIQPYFPPSFDQNNDIHLEIDNLSEQNPTPPINIPSETMNYRNRQALKEKLKKWNDGILSLDEDEGSIQEMAQNELKPEPFSFKPEGNEDHLEKSFREERKKIIKNLQSYNHRTMFKPSET